ncbi:Concanavalin A-like lectins/glucanases protein [Dioscorea alata]|nr:Concanavalin A-like lectins/glucanases protein [Dioscorea alata]KAH7652236.1 Concanavalin A-like lectins/glucanases protein [Dioscorea alata]
MLEQSACNPAIASVLLKSMRRILQLAFDESLASFKSLDTIARVLKVACIQAQELKKFKSSIRQLDDLNLDLNNSTGMVHSKDDPNKWASCMEYSLELFIRYLSLTDDAKRLVLHNAACIDCLFDLYWEENCRNSIMEHIIELIKLPPLSSEDQTAKLWLCSKYMETFTRAKERESDFAEVALDLLSRMRHVLLTDRLYYQKLFCDGECFLHIISLLNGTIDDQNGELLLLNVLGVMALLLAGNNESKVALRALVGVGYQTLQSLLLDFCKSRFSEEFLNALLDMLVDGKFDVKDTAIIKNEDVILLFANILQKSSAPLKHYGLDVLLKLLKDSIANRTSCSRAGLLSFLLDWFVIEENDDMISKIAQLLQVIGGHSISGKDIRKIFALLRSNKIRCNQFYSSLLLSTVSYMLKEKGPEAFFEFSGYDSGIVIKTPVQWPCSKGFSFTCWLRVEDFRETGMMGLFCFLSDNGRGCLAMLGQDKMYFESINQKLQSVSLPINILPNKWHFLTITHSIGRAFSGGSTVKCYIDGVLISSEKCRYAKISEVLTHCRIGTDCRSKDTESQFPAEKAYPFHGQIGPIYIFSDCLSSEQIKGIYCLGPSYMYSFFCDEVPLTLDITFSNGILDAKDGLSSKILFGLNAQASKGRALFNVTTVLDNPSEDDFIVATVMNGTQLCSRRLLQEIIYCVGGAFVFFPLLTDFDRFESHKGENEYTMMKIMSDKLPAQVIELIASFLDGKLANQQHMHHHSGFAVLGFLFESIPTKYLNMETLSSLKYLFEVLRSCGMSELLLKDAILRIYLNPQIWVYANYEVQRDLYMYLIHYFETDRSLSPSLLGFPWIIGMICQFYCDDTSLLRSKSHLHSIAREVIGERPISEEVRKIRLLLLSLGEISLRQKISASDITAIIAFFERSQDMVCIEDVLHMIIRALSHKSLLASFLEQVNLLGGCHVFINLLERELEPIRLLGLQLMGKLLIRLPSEKKGTKFFSLPIGRSKSISENIRKGASMKQQTIFTAISDRLFKFPLSDHLCATLFDVLLGGASPKQVLQKSSQWEKEKDNKSFSSRISSHFFLPHVLVCIFKFLASCNDLTARERILKDLFELLDSNPSNIECLMEYGWNSWLETSVKLYRTYGLASGTHLQSSAVTELALMRNLFCVVLSHYILSVKGGWHQLEETVYFLLLNFEEGELLLPNLLLNIFEDLVGTLAEASSEENIFASQPSRDNALYLLKLLDEMLILEIGENILFPGIGISSSIVSNSVQLDIQKDINCAVTEILSTEADDQPLRITWSSKSCRQPDNMGADEYLVFYDRIWVLIGELNGKGAGKMLPKSSLLGLPSFGQRARGLVESLNIPAAEMAAVVVSGGLGNALSGKANKYVDKAIPLRGERCPRIIFHLLVLYLCKADLGRASKCVQQLISLLPALFISDDDQSKNKLHLFIWSLLTIRSQHGMQDDGARFHIISHLLLETINSAKALLATSILFNEESYEASSNMKEASYILNIIQRDRVLAAAVDEAKYVRTVQTDCIKQLKELQVKLDEFSHTELNERKAFEDEMQADLNVICSSDNHRRASAQLAHDEEHQIVSAKWIHLSRALSDERGPWSSNSVPTSTVTHWKLDKTEDRWRRRPKLKRNYQFNQQLCHPPAIKSVSDATNLSSDCHSSSQVPDKVKHFLLKGVRGITEEGASDRCQDSNDSATLNNSHSYTTPENQSLKPSEDCSNQVDFVPEGKNTPYSGADSQSTEVQFSIPCVLVTPKRKLAGHLSLMQNVLHFLGEFLVEGTGGASIFKNFDSLRTSDANKRDLVGGTINLELDHEKGGTEKINTNAFSDNQPTKIKWRRRWNVSKIKAVHLTRYLLQFTAIEIFFNDLAHAVFFNFASQNDAKHVGTVIVSLRNESLFPRVSLKDKSGVISFVDRRTAIEIAETSRESWRRREISNFEYLMILNTLTGRSYNDLTQYPVFPWVLADYSSEKLDFNNSSTFRDLSKPVGALDEKRFQAFEDRYRNFSDPDIPSFYYGSHYSSMGIVLFYLLRLEPFTTLHRSLQGGKFDHADRLFHSIEGTYRNCLSNTSDVKELIPEFFYMPEFLVNSNSYHLGVKQDGERLDDVLLPPWAKGSPEEFIYRNREALESEYVSSNLHHWIDLVFGYKQRGKPAVEAANVFYYLTYEGAVDLESMDDVLQRSAIEDQIANFGQTPIQIFRKKHPRRGLPIPIAHPLYFAPASITLSSIVSSTTYPPSAVLFVSIVDSNVVIVNQGLILSVKTWLTTQLQSGGNFTFSGSQDPFFAIGSDVLPPRKVGTPLAENFELRRQCLATMQTSGESYLVSCGNWENSFQIISLNDGRIVQNIRQHKDVVSCVAVTSDGSILATGSFDTTIMIWHACPGRSSEKRSRNIQTDFPRKDQVVQQAPVHILCGHDDIITCLFISTELDIVISGSKDGTCIFHTLREGRYVRSIKHPSGCALSKLVASQHGRLVFYSENDLGLHMYSINGKHIASSESNGRLNCLELSSCGDFLVCAGDHGHVVLHSMHSLDVIRRYEGTGKMIASLAVTPEECFIAGTKDGSLLIYSIENLHLRGSSLPRNTKLKTSTI